MDTFIHALKGSAARFGKDTRGNIAMMSGVIALPFIGMLALAVDVNYASNHRHMVQSSLDSALLAASRKGVQGDLTTEEMQAELKTYFESLVNANGAQVVCADPVIKPTLVNGLVNADVSCHSPTIMAGLIGHEQIDYELSSEVNFGIGKIDVAFVFDVSGSMDDEVSGTSCQNGGSNCSQGPKQSRMEALQDAAKAGVAQLLVANSADVDDVRIAMVSYNQAVNAGDYFKAVTGLDAERKYVYGDGGGAATGVATVEKEGSYNKHLYVSLYNSETNQWLAEIRDETVLTVSSGDAENLTIVAAIRSSSGKYGKDESMELRVTSDSGHDYTKIENAPPYALFGDSGGHFGDGYVPTDEWARIRVRTYMGHDATGRRITSKWFDFKINVEESEESVTITDTCTYERNNSNWNKTVAPGPNNYLTADEATYDPDSDYWTTPSGCSSATPLPLTADQQELDDYIDALPTGGGTAGHLGVAWGRYLIAPEWSSVWPADSEPLAYNEPDGRKIVIMMTDGQFNRTYHSNLGSSFNQAKNHCDQAKAQNIIIYTISFDAPPDAQAALDYCSSGSEYAFDVNNGQELLDAYTSIANRISDLRISS